MAITITEKHESRRVVNGPNPSVELAYNIVGTSDDVLARMTLEAQTSLAWDLYGDNSVLLPLEAVGVDPVYIDENDPNSCIWQGFARYGVIPYNESVFQFETGGGTRHITHSLETIDHYWIGAPGSTAPDHKGAIGVTKDGIDGVDIVDPIYQWSETHYLPAVLMTGAYKARLYGLTGKVNGKSFRGFSKGEVLFLGASGGKRGRGDWEITFRFAASPNLTDQQIGDITGIEREGWQVLWVEFEDVEDAASKRMVRRPFAVHIEKVYEYGDFAGLGIGTA